MRQTNIFELLDKVDAGERVAIHKDAIPPEIFSEVKRVYNIKTGRFGYIEFLGRRMGFN